jgi:hypothetical protein
METADLIDYAYPTMMAEKYLKQIHKAMLVHDHAEAREAALKAMAEIKLALNAIAYMKEVSRL